MKMTKWLGRFQVQSSLILIISYSLVSYPSLIFLPLLSHAHFSLSLSLSLRFSLSLSFSLFLFPGKGQWQGQLVMDFSLGVLTFENTRFTAVAEIPKSFWCSENWKHLGKGQWQGQLVMDFSLGVLTFENTKITAVADWFLDSTKIFLVFWKLKTPRKRPMTRPTCNGRFLRCFDLWKHQNYSRGWLNFGFDQDLFHEIDLSLSTPILQSLVIGLVVIAFHTSHFLPLSWFSLSRSLALSRSLVLSPPRLISDSS